MFNILLQHKILAGIALIVILGGVWYGLSSSSVPAPILQTDRAVADADQGLVATLLTLRAVTLSGTIFSDPVFMSLQDFGKDIVSEPVGRPNPFAPLESSVLPTASTTKGARIFGPGER